MTGPTQKEETYGERIPTPLTKTQKQALNRTPINTLGRIPRRGKVIENVHANGGLGAGVGHAKRAWTRLRKNDHTQL